MTRPVRDVYILDGLAFIPLTMGKTAIVDECDSHIVGGYTWTCAKRGDLFYAYRKELTEFKQSKTVLMHRLIMNAPNDLHVDHVDGDGLNNTRKNIRFCTRSQNMMNRRKPKNNTSGYKGVKITSSGRWEAGIRANGIYHYLGLFDTPEAAHLEYIKASGRLHLDFSRTV